MGVFQSNVFQNAVFQGPHGSSTPSVGEHAPHEQTGAGGYLKAWKDHWKDKAERERRRAELLALVHASAEYKRLKRRLDMLHELLLDGDDVKGKIAEIERQIEMMERL